MNEKGYNEHKLNERMFVELALLISFYVIFKEVFMPKAIDVVIECPFYKGEGKDYIACEGVIKGTVDKHFFRNIKDKGLFENSVCGSECGRRCIHYKRVNELYEKGLR